MSSKQNESNAEANIIMLVDFSYHSQIQRLGLDFFPSKGGKCMGYYSFDLRYFLSPRTSIGFHKRLKITRGRNKSRDQRLGPNSGTKVCKH